MESENSIIKTSCYRIDKKRIKQLKKIINDNFSEVFISIKTIKGKELKLESFKEVIKYENFKEAKMHSLIIKGKDKYSDDYANIVFTAQQVYVNKENPTFALECKLHPREKEEQFKYEINKFLEKSKVSYSSLASFFMDKVRQVVIVMILPLYIFLDVELGLFESSIVKRIEETFPFIFSKSIFVIIFILLLSMLLVFIYSKLLNPLPTVSFEFGEEKYFIKAKERLRQSILWSFILPTFFLIIGLLLADS